MSDAIGTPRHPAIERLDRASADLLEREQLLTRLIEVTDRHTAAATRCDELRARLEVEERDVTRLERHGVRRTMATLRGTRDADLHRELAEADSAASAYELARAESERLADEVTALRRSVGSRAGAVEAYEEALALVVAAAEVGVAAGEPGIDPLVVVRVRNVVARRRERVEVEQAVTAGRTAMAALDRAEDSLRSASSWSDWDTFGGGGVISSSIKHDRMDQARSHIEAAKAALTRFAAELDDLGLPGIALPTSDGATRTVDIWFDNIFTDMRVREQIKSSLASVQRVMAHVAETLGDLEARRRELAPHSPLD